MFYDAVSFQCTSIFTMKPGLSVFHSSWEILSACYSRKMKVLKTKRKVIPSLSQLPIIQTFKGNRKKFELSRVKLYRKCSEGKWKLLQVSGRFELPGVDWISQPETFNLGKGLVKPCNREFSVNIRSTVWERRYSWLGTEDIVKESSV